MPRAVAEWRGKTDDSMPPKSVVLRLAAKQGGRCLECGRKLVPGKFTREHLKPLSMGGENRESNLALLCTSPCAIEKTSAEAAPRAKADRQAANALGLRRASKKPFPGGKGDIWRRAYDKETGRWKTVPRR